MKKERYPRVNKSNRPLRCLVWCLLQGILGLGLQAQGSVVVEWADGRWEGLTGQWEVPGLQMAIRKTADSEFPVGSLRSSFLAMGPLVPQGGLALEKSWNSLEASSALWAQSPGWVMGALPEQWSSGGIFLGNRRTPGGVYLQGSQDRWKGGAYVWGPFFFSLPELRFFAGAEGSWEPGETPAEAPYGELPEPGDRTLGTGLGLHWTARPLKFQIWTWSKAGVVQKPMGSGVVFLGLMEKGWSTEVLAMGSLGRTEGRLASLGGKFSKSFPLGDWQIKGLWNWMDTGPAWEGEVRGALSDQAWSLWSQGRWEDSPEKGRSLFLAGGGEAGWAFFRGTARVKVAEEVYAGALWRSAEAELQTGLSWSFYPDKWNGELRGKIQVGAFSFSGTAVWDIPGSWYPGSWEAAVKFFP